MSALRLLALIDYLPIDSALSGSRMHADAGWSAADEMSLSVINQLIMLRRSWVDAKDQHRLTPVEMPWHKAAAAKGPLASVTDMKQFFGRRVRIVE